MSYHLPENDHESDVHMLAFKLLDWFDINEFMENNLIDDKFEYFDNVFKNVTLETIHSIKHTTPVKCKRKCIISTLDSDELHVIQHNLERKWINLLKGMIPFFANSKYPGIKNISAQRASDIIVSVVKTKII